MKMKSVMLGASDQHKSDSGQQYDAAAIPTTSSKATATCSTASGSFIQVEVCQLYRHCTINSSFIFCIITYGRGPVN